MKENLMYLLVVGVVALCQSIMPFIGSREYSFGVHTPRGQYGGPKLFTNRWAYFISVYMITFVAANYINRKSIPPRGLIIILLFLAISYLVLLAVYHQKSLDVKKEEAWTDMAIRREMQRDPSYTIYMWAGCFLRMFLLTVIVTGALYATMPEQMPVLVGFAGIGGFFLPKSILTAIAPAIPQALLGLLLANFLKRSSKRWSAFITIVGVLTMGVLLLVPFGYAGWLSWQAIGLYSAVVAAFGVGYALLLSFGKKSAPQVAENEASLLHLSDEQWKFGVFYINKQDPTLFLPKRFGLGWTPNFAQPKAVAVFAFLTAVGLYVTYLFIIAL